MELPWRSRASMQVQSLLGELRSHMPWGIINIKIFRKEGRGKLYYLWPNNEAAKNIKSNKEMNAV